MKKQIQTIMNKAMNMVMLSCDDATLLITKSAYTKLGFFENLQLKMHLMGCKFCRLFNLQNEHLSHQINEFAGHQHEKLSLKKKEELKKVLSE